MASAISPVADSESTARVVDASSATDVEEEEALELIEFRYQGLWARVELEALFAAGLMSHS